MLRCQMNSCTAEFLGNMGSAQQSVRVRILRGLLESDEFGRSGSQSLRLQQQIVHGSITAAATEQSFDGAGDGFNHAHWYLRPAVVQDAREMIQKAAGWLLHGFQPL